MSINVLDVTLAMGVLIKKGALIGRKGTNLTAWKQKILISELDLDCFVRHKT